MRERSCLVLAAIAALLVVPGQAQASDEATPLIQPSTAEAATPASAVGATTPTPADGLSLRRLPLVDRHDYERGLAALVPGAAVTDAGVRLRGGGAKTLARTIDGFRVYQLQPPLLFVDRVDFWASGHGIERSDAPDGLIALTTLAPTAALHAGSDLHFGRNPHRQSTAVPEDAPVFAPDSIARNETRRALTGTVTGPVLGDRLMLAGVVRLASSAHDGEVDFRGVVPDGPRATAYVFDGGLNATLRLAPRHQLQMLLLGAIGESLNDGPNSLLGEAQPARNVRKGMAGLRWTGQLGRALQAHGQVSAESAWTRDLSMLCRSQPDTCEQVPAVRRSFPINVVFDNSEHFDVWSETHLQAEAGVLTTLQTGSLAQRLRLTSRLERGAFEHRFLAPGGGTTEVDDAQAVRKTSYFADDPRFGAESFGIWSGIDSRSLVSLTTLEDQLAFRDRVFVTPGVGLVHARLHGGGGAPLLVESTSVFHLGVSIKLAEDGGTLLRASSGRRVDPTARRLAENLSSPQHQQDCLFDPSTNSFSRDCVASGGARGRTVGLPCGPTGYRDDGSRCIVAPRMPRTWEHTLGLRQALSSWAYVDLDLVARETTGLDVGRETNRVWNDNIGTPALPFRNGFPGTVYDTSLLTELTSRYRGGTATLATAVGGLRGYVAYTHARQQVTGVNLQGRGPIATYRNDDADEVRHAARVVAAYAFPQTSFAVAYRYDSGRPRPGAGARRPSDAFSDLRMRVGGNPGVDINTPSDDRGGPPRLPGQGALDLQMRVCPKFGLPVALDFYLDIIDALGFVGDVIKIADGTFRDAWVHVGTELRY